MKGHAARLQRTGKLALDLIFPRRCPWCDQPVRPFGGLICGECERELDGKELSPERDALCCRCGKPLLEKERELCHDCEKQARAFRKGCTVYRYHDVSGMLYRLKYEGRAEYADYIGGKMAERLQSEFDPKAIDLLVPVPSSGDRMRKRGYNQAALLGRVISGKTGIPLREDLLLRTGSTGAMRNLSASERRRNLKSAFIVPDIDVESVVIMLVDDIFTTGATADACAQMLLRAGAAEVLVLTAAAGDDRS